jgi:hypothetical protein
MEKENLFLLMDKLLWENGIREKEFFGEIWQRMKMIKKIFKKIK